MLESFEDDLVKKKLEAIRRYKDFITKLPEYEAFIKESPKHASFQNAKQAMQVLQSLTSIEE